MWLVRNPYLAVGAVAALFFYFSGFGGSTAENVVGHSFCHKIQGNRFIVCEIDLRTYELKIFWKNSKGKQYASFKSLTEQVRHTTILFGINAGIYRVKSSETDSYPLGLLIDSGYEFNKLNMEDGDGNFFVKPNGVFYVRGENGAVLTSEKFQKLRPNADIATQSGPMLVIDGKINEAFEGFRFEYVRHGVCAPEPHTVAFVISNIGVTFEALARVFSDTLGCANALYLDGKISRLYAPTLKRADSGVLGPIIAAVKRSR